MNRTRIIIYIFAILLLASCAKTEYTEAEHIARADSFFKEEKYNSAIIELKNALRKNPDNGGARLKLAEIYLLVDDGPGAEKELLRARDAGVAWAGLKARYARALFLQNRDREILALNSEQGMSAEDMARLHVLRGKVYMRQGQLALAGTEIDKAEKLAKQLAEVKVAAAEHLLLSGKVESAEKKLQSVIEENRSYIPALYLMAKLSFQQHELDKAAHYYEEVIENTPPGILTRKLYQSRVDMALIAIMQKDEQKAKEQIAFLDGIKMLQYVPEYLRALQAYEKKDYRLANEHLLLAYEKNPEYYPAVLLLGAVNYALGYYNQAALYLGKYVSRYPDNLAGQAMLGATRMKLNQPEMAMEAYLVAAKLAPNDRQLLATVGNVALRAGNASVGQRYLKAALGEENYKKYMRERQAFNYIKEGKYESAVNVLSRNAGKDAENIRTQFLLVEAYVRKKDYRRAREIADRLKQEQPDNPLSYQISGYVHQSQGQVQLALADYSKALSLDERFVPALLKLAEIESHSGNYAKARAHYNAVLSIDEKNVTSMIGMARVEEKQGNQAKAADWLKQATSADKKALRPRVALISYYLATRAADEALSMARETAEIFPKNPLALSLLADAQMANGLHEKARATFEELVALAPESPENHARLARVQLQLKQPAAARQHLEQALKLRPGYFPAIALLAHLEARSGKLDTALRLAEQAIRQSPDSARGYELRGDLLLQAKKYARAAASYGQAYRRQAEVKYVLRQYEALDRKGDVGKANRVLQKWLERKPADNNVRLLLASSLHGAGDVKSATAHYEKILARQPANVIVLNNLALIYLEDAPARARQLAEKAYRLVPDKKQIIDTYAWVLVHNGQLQEANRLFDKALRLDPADPDIRYHKAYCLYQLGQKREAKSMLAELLGQKTDFSERKAARQLYTKLQ